MHCYSIQELEPDSEVPMYEVVTSRNEEDPEWDALVLNCPDPHHEQTSLWGAAQRIRGWEAMRILVRRNGGLVGGVQILERALGRFVRVGYIHRGPLASIDDDRLRGRLVHAIGAYARARHLTYLSVVLPYGGSPWVPHLKAQAFGISHPSLPPRTSMRSTIVLDLEPELDELMAGMRRTTRTHVRQGSRRGLHFREGEQRDLQTFETLLAALCQRRGVSPNIPGGNFLQELWRRFAPSGHLKLFLTEQKGEQISALLAFTTGHWFRVWRVGWSGEHAGMRPNQLMYWEAIKWARLNGYKYFENSGFDTDNARAMVEGRDLSKSVWCGMSFFKLGFGGKVLPLDPGYCFFSNPVVRAVFHLAKPNGFASRIGEFLVGKAMARFRRRR